MHQGERQDIIHHHHRHPPGPHSHPIFRLTPPLVLISRNITKSSTTLALIWTSHRKGITPTPTPLGIQAQLSLSRPPQIKQESKRKNRFIISSHRHRPYTQSTFPPFSINNNSSPFTASLTTTNTTSIIFHLSPSGGGAVGLYHNDTSIVLSISPSPVDHLGRERLRIASGIRSSSRRERSTLITAG